MKTVEEISTMFRGIHEVMEKELPQIFSEEYREGFLAATKELEKEIPTDG